MAYMPVPKDLSKVKTKVLFDLTKRQLICFSCGALIGVPLFLCARRTHVLRREAPITLRALIVAYFFVITVCLFDLCTLPIWVCLVEGKPRCRIKYRGEE